MVKKKTGKIPKKSKGEQLSKRITTATTEKLKEEVKERAKSEDESVSQFVRLSIRDKVYAETHPEADLKDLVAEGHDALSYVRRPEIAKKASSISTSDVKGDNTVLAYPILTVLKYFQPLKFKSEATQIFNVLKVDFYEDKLDLAFCSGEITERVTLAQFHGNLHLFLNLDVLYDLFSNISPDSKVRFEEDGNSVKVHIGDNQVVRIEQSQSPNVDYLGYLDIKEDKGAESFTISSSLLKELLQSTEYAMEVTDDLTLPFANGTEMVVSAQMFHLVAMDGYRMAYVTYFPLSDTVLHSHQTFVASEGVYALIKMLKMYANDEKTDVIVSDNRAAFRVKRQYYDVELVVGNSKIEYPNYKNVLPSGDGRDIQLHLRVKADTLYKALKETATHCDKKRELVVIEWHKGYDIIKLIVKNSRGSRAEQSVLVSVGKDNVPLEDNVFRVGFNPHFLMEPLKLWSTNGYGMNPDHLVDMDFTVSGSLVMTPAGEDLKALAVIMPIKITEYDY